MPGTPAQGSSARKVSPHNFWLQKPARIYILDFDEILPDYLPLRKILEKCSQDGSVGRRGSPLERVTASSLFLHRTQ